MGRNAATNGRRGAGGGGPPTPIEVPGAFGTYTYTVAGTLSGGTLDGWKVQRVADLDALVENAGVLETTTTSNSAVTLRAGFDKNVRDCLIIYYPEEVDRDFTLIVRTTKVSGHAWTFAGPVAWQQDATTSSSDRSATSKGIPHLADLVQSAFPRDASSNTTPIGTWAGTTTPLSMKLERSGKDLTMSYRLLDSSPWTDSRTGSLDCIGSSVLVGIAIDLHATSAGDRFDIDVLEFTIFEAA